MKCNDVANAIVAANRDVTFNRARDAATDELSRLLKDGEIRTTKRVSKKDGYLYEII